MLTSGSTRCLILYLVRSMDTSGWSPLPGIACGIPSRSSKQKPRGPFRKGKSGEQMRYMFLIYSQETDEPRSAEEIDRVISGHRAVMADAGQKGILLGVERLKPTRTATTVRM